MDIFLQKVNRRSLFLADFCHFLPVSFLIAIPLLRLAYNAAQSFWPLNKT